MKRQPAAPPPTQKTICYTYIFFPFSFTIPNVYYGVANVSPCMVQNQP
jgi:hypothetical protein